MAYLPYALTSDEEEVIRSLEPVFMYKGKPTEEYKSFLLEAIFSATTVDTQTRCDIQNILMRCEEGAYVPVNGIMSVLKTDPRYDRYCTIMNAVYDHPVCIHADKIDICNTIVVHFIQALEKGCNHKHCYRKNPLHKEWMHRPLQC